MTLTISRKIVLGFVLACLLIALNGIAFLRGTGRLIDNAAGVSQTQQVIDALHGLLATVADAESGARGYAITGDEAYLEPYTHAENSTAEQLKLLRTLKPDGPLQQKNLDALEGLMADKFRLMRQTIEIRKQNQVGLVAEFMRTHQSRQTMSAIRNIVSTMAGEEQRLLQERGRRTQDSAQSARWAIIVGSVFGLIVIPVSAILTLQSIKRPLVEFNAFVSSVADGDLTLQSTVRNRDELGEFAHGLNRMVASLREITGQTRTATQDLNSAASEILVSAQRQSASTGDQAAALQQTNVTMQEISQSSVQISERAKQVATIAEATAAGSDSGLRAVENTQRMMDSIRKHSEALAETVVALSLKTQVVGEIIATVNDISEQSHIVALNAAIEAAAAGEHGRTFAVVASEVKNLADQSKEATIQVRSILGDIQKGINSSVMLTEEAVKRAESGREQAGVAAGTIREMAGSIHQSVQAFQQIVAGTNQQQIGFEQVMQAVKEIGKASDHTAASTRELERASSSLMTLGQQLGKAMDRYRI